MTKHELVMTLLLSVSFQCRCVNYRLPVMRHASGPGRDGCGTGPRNLLNRFVVIYSASSAAAQKPPLNVQAGASRHGSVEGTERGCPAWDRRRGKGPRSRVGRHAAPCCSAGWPGRPERRPSRWPWAGTARPSRTATPTTAPPGSARRRGLTRSPRVPLRSTRAGCSASTRRGPSGPALTASTWIRSPCRTVSPNCPGRNGIQRPGSGSGSTARRSTARRCGTAACCSTSTA